MNDVQSWEVHNGRFLVHFEHKTHGWPARELRMSLSFLRAGIGTPDANLVQALGFGALPDIVAFLTSEIPGYECDPS